MVPHARPLSFSFSFPSSFDFSFAFSLSLSIHLRYHRHYRHIGHNCSRFLALYQNRLSPLSLSLSLSLFRIERLYYS